LKYFQPSIIWHFHGQRYTVQNNGKLASPTKVKRRETPSLPE